MSETINLMLSTSTGDEDSVYKGDSLTLYVSVDCYDSLETENYNDSIQLDIQELEERYRNEDIEQEEYEKKLEEYESRKIQIDSPQIGSIQQPWYESIRFINLETKEQLNWEFVATSKNPEEPVIEFGTVSSAHIGFQLSPEKLENISPRSYFIYAKIDETESDPIKVSISHEVEVNPSEGKKWRRVEYLLGTGVLDEALDEIKGTLTQSPDSVRGHMLMGEYHKAKNDWDAALESYFHAKELFQSKYPDSYEPPVTILQKISEIYYYMSRQE